MTTDVASRPVAQPGILDIAPYVGGEAKVEGLARVRALAANETPLGPSPLAVEAYKAAADRLHRYPEGGSTLLREAIGSRYDLDPDRIVCGNGSDEVLSLLTSAYAGPGDEVLHSAHGFLMYKISAMSVGATPVSAPETDLKTDVKAILECVTDRTRILFIANPNNPTGSYLNGIELRRLIEALPPRVLVVIDAAYAEYVGRNDYLDGIGLVDAFENVVVTRTFSKIYGLAALRLGWCYAPEHVVSVLNRVRGPFNVTHPAQVAGAAAIADLDHVERARRHNNIEKPRLTEGLRRLGLPVNESVGNFVLAHFPDPERSAAMALTALKQQGILVRGMSGYGLPDHLRITVGLSEDVDALLAALEGFLGGGK